MCCPLPNSGRSTAPSSLPASDCTVSQDVIAAIATASGRGGIGVIRISGPALQGLAFAFCGREPQPRVATLTRFVDAKGEPIDQGILLYFPAPNSFTGEDVLELQGHGGPVVMQLLLQRCLELGARLAHPGEFTQRAFLNDKLDLAQAEAVADLIDAASTQAARSAMRSLAGDFSRLIARQVERLIELRMLLEATLDFPDEEIDAASLLREARVHESLHDLREQLAAIVLRARQGSLLRRGLQVVLIGEPNVGKSSLLNALAGEDRAIVTDIAGTTRDALREQITIEGIPLHIIDTAGLRDTDDVVERLGIQRSWQEVARADVVVELLDARCGVLETDPEILRRLPAHAEHLVVHNKCDLLDQPAKCEHQQKTHIYLSALTGAGMELLQQELLRCAGWQQQGEDLILARERHLRALAKADEHLALAQQQDELELMAEDLRLAQLAFTEITGEYTADDLLGAIFSRFCIGK